MLAQPLTLTLLLVSWATSSFAAAHIRNPSGADRNHGRSARRAVNPPAVVEARSSNDTVRRSLPRRCIKHSTSTSIASSTSATQTVVQVQTSTSSSAPPATTSVAHVDTSSGNGKPANWPTTTQAGPIPSILVANKADPNLVSLSYALNNKQNTLYTQKYTGDITYYGQGLGACGDTYDDKSFTAAVSMKLFDIWPGASAEQNRNAICGPFTTGRNVLSQTGVFEAAIKSSTGAINIGGDGLPNCMTGKQCHVPLTATVTNPATGKSVVVQIVDRCVDCADGDIDLTPTAFQAIADMSLGRVSGCTWSFNQY